MYLVYKTCDHHSRQNGNVIGVATDQLEAIIICQALAKDENEEIKGDALYTLQNLDQTQGYAGDGEFVIEEIETNILF